MGAVDRARLPRLMAEETERFVARTPRPGGPSSPASR